MSIFKKIFNWISGAAKKVAEALSNGKAVANEIKAVADSPILSAVVNMTATNIDNVGLQYLRTGLSTFIILMGWGEKAIADFKEDPDAKAIVLTALNAKAAKLTADYNGAKLTIQQAIASAPVLYDPKIIK
jgi:hypothetical protein